MLIEATEGTPVLAASLATHRMLATLQSGEVGEPPPVTRGGGGRRLTNHRLCYQSRHP